jgi:hypothetical protein
MKLVTVIPRRAAALAIFAFSGPGWRIVILLWLAVAMIPHLLSVENTYGIMPYSP